MRLFNYFAAVKLMCLIIEHCSRTHYKCSLISSECTILLSKIDKKKIFIMKHIWSNGFGLWIWFGKMKWGELSNFILRYSHGFTNFKYFIVSCLTFPLNYGYFKTKMGNAKLGRYAPWPWYWDSMKDDIDTPHIENRASVLNVSNPGEKWLEMFCQDNFGETGLSLENQKGNEDFMFRNSYDIVTS